MAYRNTVKFNREWFNEWKNIKSIEPHYVGFYNLDCEKCFEEIGFIDIIFKDGDRIRIEADGESNINPETHECEGVYYLTLKIAKMEEITLSHPEIEEIAEEIARELTNQAISKGGEFEEAKS